MPSKKLFIVSVASTAIVLSSGDATAQYIDPGYAETGVNEIYTHWGETPNEQYGYVSETIGDLDGDGVPEVLNSAPFRPLDGATRVGSAFVHSGRTGEVLATHSGNTTLGFFGWRLARLGDLDGDGIEEYAVGAAGNVFSNNPTVPGQVFVYSGADHTLVAELNAADYATTDPTLGNDRFGHDVSALSDIDGDGTPELIVTADLWDEAGPNRGRAWVLSGADFSVVRTHDGEEDADRFGSCANPMGDMNGDGVWEYLVCARDGGELNRGIGYVYDGATGSELFRISGDSPTQLAFGQYFASSPGDCTGDGVPDIFVGDFVDGRHGFWTGAAYLFDGAAGLSSENGLLLPYWSVVGDESRQSVGFGGGVGDVDGDGLPDVATSFLSNSETPGSRWAGIVRVYSGKTGKILRTITSLRGDGPTFADWGEQFGYAVSGIGDASGNGVPDLFVTAGFGRSPDDVTVGRVYAIEGIPPCDADFDGDLDADFNDVLAFLDLLISGARAADLAAPFGAADFNDVLSFLARFAAGCP